MQPPPDPVDIHVTRWSLVLATRGDGAQAAAALEELCRNYWRPLWAFAKGRFTLTPEDAEDMVQGFMAHVVQREIMATASPEKGRFRSFLFGCLQNYGLNELAKLTAHKRGGGQSHVPTTLPGDFALQEQNEGLQTEAEAREYADVAWAQLTLQRAFEALKKGYIKRALEARFYTLKTLAMGAEGESSHAAAAVEMGITQAAVAVELHRFRKRLKEAFSREVRETVASAEDEVAECRYLLKLVL